MLNAHRFIENPAIRTRREHFLDLEVMIPALLEGWRLSLSAHRWLMPDGRVKGCDELTPRQLKKRQLAEANLSNGTPLVMPVLGIGINETIEIGAGAEIVTTLSALGHERVQAHIPLIHIEDFRDFLTESTRAAEL